MATAKSTRKSAAKSSDKPGASGAGTKPSRKAAVAKSSKPRANAEPTLLSPVMQANIRSLSHPVTQLRDGTQVVTPKSAQPYRVAAPHNAEWWEKVTTHCKTHHGQATVKSLTDAGVPGIFVSYCLRRKWLIAVTK